MSPGPGFARPSSFTSLRQTPIAHAPSTVRSRFQNLWGFRQGPLHLAPNSRCRLIACACERLESGNQLGARRRATGRRFDQVLVERLDPELPSRRRILEVGRTGGDKLVVRMLWLNANLEALHDPGISGRIVQQQGLRPLAPTHAALARDGHGFLGLAVADTLVAFHVQLGHSGGLDTVEWTLYADLDFDPVGHPPPGYSEIGTVGQLEISTDRPPPSRYPLSSMTSPRQVNVCARPASAH